MSVLVTLIIYIWTTFMPANAATPDPSKDCRSAIVIAEKFLPTLKIAGPQKLIRVENLYLNPKHKIEPNLWKVTFKDTQTIPRDGPIGAGGEIFIEVDLSTKKARFLGTGE
ncbi:hypothetical protein BH10CYA1_BH10CYA1_54450 [soil metagenome]